MAAREECVKEVGQDKIAGARKLKIDGLGRKRYVQKGLGLSESNMVSDRLSDSSKGCDV